jgi:alpha-glucosidase
MWHLNSPTGILKATIAQTQTGGLFHRVGNADTTMLVNSPLGILSDLEDFTVAMEFVKAQQQEIHETYSLPVGKKAQYINHCQELELTFQKGGERFILRYRAYDEGIAFRYEIPHTVHRQISIPRETTDFCIAQGFDDLWLQDWTKTYEGTYNARIWDYTLIHQHYGMPCLLHHDALGYWMMISEAHVLSTHGAYCSSHLLGMEGRRFGVAFAPELNGMPITTSAPFVSPWRFVTIADSLDALVNTTMNYNLNPPAASKDYSWVKPARSLWAWWEYENAAQLYTESKAYIDIAAAMGFEAVTLDCPWDANSVKALCDYAHSKNVQVWIWSAMQQLDTLEKAHARIPLWASWGVDGLKVDFFENDSCHTMWQYNMIADLMTEHQLMINFHGATKPMGEGRTWPNFMTSEGILGLEHYKWSNLPDAAHNCTVPFTRNVLGPMDYTPTGFSNHNRNTSMAHQMALSVVFESGVTHYSLSLHYLEAWQGTDFLRRTLPKYDGMRVLSGYPGDHAAILRYSGDRYLVGVINTYKRYLPLSLDFLPDGDFEAEVFEDDYKGESITVRRLTVDRNTTLELKLVENGGAGLYIAPKIRALSKGVCSGYMSANVTDYPASHAILRGGSEPISLDTGMHGITLNAGAEYAVDVPENKRYTLRFFYSAVGAWTLSAQAGEHCATESMPATGHYKTFITHQLTLPLEAGRQTLRIARQAGKVPTLFKMLLIDNDPEETVDYSAEEAEVTGDAEQVRTEDGVWEAVGLGGEAKMIFRNIELSKDGLYVLRIDYCAGEDRKILIESEAGESVDTYLHHTSGWDYPHWDRPEGKEVLIPLHAGSNQITLSNPNGAMAHIRGIALTWEK